MLSRAVALATIFGAILSACALDTSGTIEGESTGSGASASGASGPGASGPGGGASGPGGAGPSTSSSSTGPGPGGAGGGPTTCGADAECLPTANEYALLLPEGTACPAGWTGGEPLAIDDDPDVGCAADCSCGGASGGTCSAGALWMGGTCVTLGQVSASPPSGCSNISPDTYRARIDPPKASTGSCPPSGGGKAAIDQRAVCRSGPVGACDGGSCVPSVTDGELCFVSAAECPRGYDGRSLYPVQEDQRECTCQCGPAPGSCQNGGTTIFTSPNCSSSSQGVPMDGATCINPNFSIEAIDIDPGDWSGGTCEPELEPGGPVVYGPALQLCCPG